MNHHLRLYLWGVLVGFIVWGALIQIQISTFDFACKRQAGGCSYIEKPVLSAELATSGLAFQAIIDQGDREHNIAAMRMNTRMDYLFILLYCALFVLFALYHNNRWSKWVIGLTCLAALCDVLENFRILACLRELEQASAVHGLTPAVFGYSKWIAFGLALVALGVLIETAGEKYRRLLGWILVALGALVLATFSLSHNAPVSPSLPSEIATLLGLILFVFCPMVLALILYYPFSIDATLAWIEYAYLIRFPIIFGLLLGVLLPLFYWLIPGIFVGIFDAVTLWSLALVVWAAFQLAWIIMITSRLVLVYGVERFPGVNALHIENVSTRTVVLFGLLAVPFVFTLCLGTLDPTSWQKLAGVLIGLATAILGLFLTAKLHFYIESDSGNTANRVFPSFGILRRTPTESRLRLWVLFDVYLKKLPPKLQGGLLREGRLRSGHELAVIAVVGLLFSYAALGILYLPQVVSPKKQPAAALYALLLLSILTWLFAGAAYFLDVLRVPVLTTLLAFSLLTGMVRTDHQFAITRHLGREALPPQFVVDKWAEEYRTNHNNNEGGADPKTAIIVATAGGGIRASAWTAEVLTGLQQTCGSEFSSSLLLVSSVSGGSVGAMSVLNGYDGADRSFPRKGVSLEEIRFNAYRSSLSSVGWGLIYPDSARTFPLLGSLIPQTIDRGWALENSWISGWDHPPNMSDWRAEVARGTRPAIIFNATGAENGKRFIVASTDLDLKNAVRFFHDFAGYDLPVSTAARLSASFPYISPETRASDGSDEVRVHVGDGGYYDNSGILSALEWLREAKGTLTGHGVKVLFVTIDAQTKPAKTTLSWSWQRQITGPLVTLLNVRTSSQDDRNNQELELEREVFGSTWVLEPVHFIYQASQDDDDGDDKEANVPSGPLKQKKSISSSLQPDESSPLSWHLNKLQIQSVRDAWTTPGNASARDRICGILKGEK